MQEKTILLVEDQAATAAIVTVQLHTMGYAVMTAATGEDSIQLVNGGRQIDLILMDIDLGSGIDGTIAARHILAQHTIPIVFLTSHCEPEIVAKVRGITRYGYVIKNSGDFVLQSSIEMAFELFEANVLLKNELAERKRAENKLRVSDCALKAVSQGVIISGPDKLIVSVNDAFMAITGYSETEILGRNTSYLQGPLTDPWTVDAIRLALENFTEFSGEILNYRKDGTLFWNELTISPVRDEQSRVTHFIGVTRDVTGRKQVEKALAESEGKYRLIAENTSDGIIIFGSNNCVDYVSPAYVKQLGYTEEEELHRTPDDLYAILHPEDRDHIFPRIFDAIRDMKSGLIYTYRAKHKAGHYIWREDNARFKYDTSGTYLGAYVVCRDITDRKQAEDNLRQIEARLRQAEKMDAIGRLAGGIAHDFNNVLGGIIGYTDMSLALADKNSTMEKNLLKVLQASDRATQLVRQILAFSRQSSPQTTVILMQPIVEEVLSLLGASIPSSVIINADLHTETKPVLADPVKIHEMLLNLATNAVYAMERKGILTVRLYAAHIDQMEYCRSGEIVPGEYSVLEVADTGCGMDAPTMEKAFEPFFTTKVVGEGTGLGLSVVLGIVQLHGGGLQVDSEPGKGTTIRIFVPVTQETIPNAVRETALGHIRGTERILFVDDELMLVEMADSMLSALGYAVTGMSASVDALRFIREHGNEVDVLVTDQTMPGMTGIELAKEALKIRKNLPIILCTGYSHEVNPERAAAIGISRFVMKPYVVHEIGRLIRDVLDNSVPL